MSLALNGLDITQIIGKAREAELCGLIANLHRDVAGGANGAKERFTEAVRVLEQSLEIARDVLAGQVSH